MLYNTSTVPKDNLVMYDISLKVLKVLKVLKSQDTSVCIYSCHPLLVFLFITSTSRQ